MARYRLPLALGTAVAAVLLAGCSASVSTGTTSDAPTSAAPTVSTAAGGYTAEIEQTFTSNCVSSATQAGTAKADAEAICGCIYRGLEAEVPFEDFVAADAAAAKGEALPDSWSTIVTSCQSEPSSF